MGTERYSQLRAPLLHEGHIPLQPRDVEEKSRRLQALKAAKISAALHDLDRGAHTIPKSGLRVSETAIGRALSAVKPRPARLCQNTGIPTLVAPGTSAADPATNRVRSGAVPSF